MPNVRWGTLDDRQRNCPKHVEFHDKNKFGKISASVGFIKKKFITLFITADNTFTLLPVFFVFKKVCRNLQFPISLYFARTDKWFLGLYLPQTWACIVVLVALVTPMLNYFHRNSPYYEYFYRNTIKGGLNSLFNCLWYVYGALMQQGQFRRFWNFSKPEMHIDNIKNRVSCISDKALLLHYKAQ